MPDLYTKYQYNDAGDLIDPPRIPDFERRLIEAGALGDTGLIESLTEDYEDKRRTMAEKHNQRVEDRASEDQRLLAERNERNRQQSADNAREQQQQRDRADADELRQQEGNPSPSPSPDATGSAQFPGAGGTDTDSTSTGQPTTVGGENP